MWPAFPLEIGDYVVDVRRAERFNLYTHAMAPYASIDASMLETIDHSWSKHLFSNRRLMR